MFDPPWLIGPWDEPTGPAGTGNELRDRIAYVIFTAQNEWEDNPSLPGPKQRHVADAVLPLIEAAVTEAEERARREVADELNALRAEVEWERAQREAITRAADKALDEARRPS